MGDVRSKTAFRNIILSVIGKLISAVTPLVFVPMTIDYLNPTRYGIWLTVCSVISWINVLDLGLGSGFRNRFTEAVAVGNNQLAKQYVSTTYCLISMIMIPTCVVLNITNIFVDWTAVLHIDAGYREELQTVVGILLCVFCLSMVVNIITTFLSAIQKVGVSSILNACGQLLSLVVVYILTRFTEGSFLNLASYVSGIPCLFLILVSLYVFLFTDNKKYAPSLNTINKALTKNILKLGVQFFIMQIAIILILQIINIVLSRELGPDAVTTYNVSYRYFYLLVTATLIIEAPYWSAFTEAYAQKDFQWMRSSMKRLEYVWVCFIVIGVVMLTVSDWFYKIWVGSTVDVSFGLSFCMLLYVLSQSLAHIYMYMINGIGTVRIQTIIYALFALLSYPILVISCRTMGIAGALIVPSLTYIALALLGKIQLNKILTSKATGIWAK